MIPFIDLQAQRRRLGAQDAVHAGPADPKSLGDFGGPEPFGQHLTIHGA